MRLPSPSSRGALFALLGAALVCLPARAERHLLLQSQPSDGYLHSHWGTDEGLPETAVNSITQQPGGMMWFSFEHSVVQFDGDRFLPLKELEEVAFGQVRLVLALKDGAVAIATRGAGVLLYDGRALRRLPIQGGTGADSLVEHLLENGEELFAIGEAGLYRRQGDHLEPVPGGNPEPLLDISAAGPGACWLLGRSHLYRVEHGAVRRMDGVLPPFVAEDGSVASGPDGTLWASMGELGVYHVGADGRVEHFGPEQGMRGLSVHAFLFQPDGSVLFGSNHGIQQLMDGRVQPFPVDGLNDDNIQALYRNEDGDIFIATYSHGLHQLRQRTVRTVRQGLAVASTWAILEDHAGALWVGTESGGVHRFSHGEVTRFATEDGLKDTLVTSLFEDRTGTLWVGTIDGLYRRRGEGRFERVGAAEGYTASRAYSIVEDADGTLYVGASPGVLRKVGERFEPVPLPGDVGKARVRYLALDGAGGLWAGGDLGLAHVAKDGTGRAYRYGDGLPNSTVTLLLRDSRGDLWVGTPDGLVRYRDGRFTLLTRAQGLPERSVLTLAEDESGDLWFGTFHGILRARRQEMEDVLAGRRPRLDGFTLGTHDGMDEAECNTDSNSASIRLRDGTIAVATMGGVALVDPKLFQRPGRELHPLVTQVAFGKEHLPPSRLAPFPPSVRDLEFDYTAPTFRDPADVTFRYRLEGYDRDWVDAGGRRQAFYTHLRPGTFRFLVEARGRDGTWSQAPAELEVTFLPHVYETWWFATLVALAGLAVAAGAYRLRVRTLQARQAELERHNADLAKALAASQEAVRVKGEFVANISHELRTPLNSIINLPEGILEMFSRVELARCEACQSRFELEPGEKVAPDAACPECGVAGRMVAGVEYTFRGQADVVVKHLKALVRSGRHLMSVINDVLDFSKLEAGKMRLQKDRLPVEELFEELAGTMEGLAREKKVGLRFGPVPDGLHLRVDRVKTAQVFLNLISNALKFSEPGAFVDVGVEPDGEFAKLWVKDTGIGIAPEHHATIFESFRQVDGSHTRKVGGTGLGLAISKDLVELHGGRLKLESTLGQGSTFFVWLPLEGTQTATPEPVQAKASVGPGRPRVVILDDEPLALETLKLVLEPMALDVEGLTDPRQLHDALGRRAADLLILDIMMPRLSGLSLLKQLRAAPQTRELPILVTSAYLSNRDIVLSLGATWMNKPWNSRELAAEVQRLLAHKARPRPAA